MQIFYHRQHPFQSCRFFATLNVTKLNPPVIRRKRRQWWRIHHLITIAGVINLGRIVFSSIIRNKRDVWRVCAFSVHPVPLLRQNHHHQERIHPVRSSIMWPEYDCDRFLRGWMLGYSISKSDPWIWKSMKSSSSSLQHNKNNIVHDEGDIAMEDFELLQTVSVSQLQGLCNALNLTHTDTATASIAETTTIIDKRQDESLGMKQDLLEKLRRYAVELELLEKQRRLERVHRIETHSASSSTSSKERYEVLPGERGDSDDDEDDFIIMIPLPSSLSNSSVPSANPSSMATSKSAKKSAKRQPLTSERVTALPPPEHVNENGERVVTIYNSRDHNDMTGIAAAQPGASTQHIDHLGNLHHQNQHQQQPWGQFEDTSSVALSASKQQLETAREVISELVLCLLATTGAPAFAMIGLDVEDDDDDYRDEEEVDDDVIRNAMENYNRNPRRIRSFYQTLDRPTNFLGFQPHLVPRSLLTTASASLRMSRGDVLQDVLRHFDLQAIGHDGKAGDDREKGGGHYREVMKIRAFLEGYRTSEVRRLARETTTLLLDTLVSQDVQGLDRLMATMSRSTDDYVSNHASELNDSLLDFLNDSIRQQESKVRREQKSPLLEREGLRTNTVTEYDDVYNDTFAQLWTVQTEDGQRIESIDPNDPKVRMALQEEYAKTESLISEVEEHSATAARIARESPSEQLLSLLRLLRQRVEAEAAFSSDEKGRNLRLLAYCLRLPMKTDQEQLILRHLGSSLDALDSFIELVASSIEYGESTIHQLQPSKSHHLNIPRLTKVLELARELRKSQSIRLSYGGRP